MKNRRANLDVVLRAGFCLLAVALLYAPFAAAAYSARTADCCAAGRCPISGHHPSQAPAAPGSPMDCGHAMAGMGSCSISCCESPERAAVTPLAFLLPAPAAPIVPAGASEFSTALQTAEIPRTLEPVAPPPRFVAAGL
ncbi:MAG: hypothetical protein LAN84_14250 [Acidobacteriia bacterium]|nr:hypothetical protein [Terriglobia bacterium]